MTVTNSDVRFDMFDREIFASPYPVFHRLREEAPLYYNEEYDFFAVSRYEDVSRVFNERSVFLSGKGMTYDIAKACLDLGMEMPDGLFICEDAPTHAMHRGLVSRLFTPRAVNALEPQIRELCVDVVDPVVERSGFDFMSTIANQIPIKVIGMLLGLPKADQAELHGVFHQVMHVEGSESGGDALAGIAAAADWFNLYLDERAANPTDDVMTQLLHAELPDESGGTRPLRRDEILTYLTLIASAGSDTTALAMGWAVDLLAQHPDQRQAVVDDPALIPTTVEEVLRYETVAYHATRWIAEDVEVHGAVVPAGSVMVVLPGAANRDDRHFAAAESFDVRRPPGQIFSFGFGPHFCLGASLARLELRIALEVILERVPSWDVDLANAALVPGINTRGWERLPISL
jgi:cytochrome P450